MTYSMLAPATTFHPSLVASSSTTPAFFCFSFDHAGHTKHQRVHMTHWLLFPPLSWPHQPQWAPTSHKDSLVASPSTTQATPSTNESLWLVGCFFHLSLNHAGYNEHQRVFMTCWYLFSPLLQPCRSQLAPTSHNDLLVPFFTSPLTTQTTTSTNESLWLIGAFFLLSLEPL